MGLRVVLLGSNLADLSSPSVRSQTLLAARAHITTAGEVVYASNLLHDAFFQVFLTAMTIGRSKLDPEAKIVVNTFDFHDHALAIWHIIQSDKSQRELAITAISTVPTTLGLRHGLAGLVWAKKNTDDLSMCRNIVAHNAVMFRGAVKDGSIHFLPQFGSSSTRPAHRKRLEMIGDLPFWHSVRDDYLKLSIYVGQIALWIQGREMARHGVDLMQAPKSLPARPRLRSLPRLQHMNRTLSQATPRTKQRARP